MNSKYAFQVKDRQFKIKKYLQPREEEPIAAKPEEETL